MNLERLYVWICVQLDDINERIKEEAAEDNFQYLIGAKNAYESIRHQMILVRHVEKE